jgi:hypothetical protein
MPVEQMQPRDAHRLLGADQPRDQEQRKVLPRRAAAGHDEPLILPTRPAHGSAARAGSGSGFAIASQ